MMPQTVFHASCAILCPEKGIFYCRAVCLNTANRHQGFVVWIEMGFAKGAGSSRDRRQSIASATLPSIGQTRQQEASHTGHPPFPTSPAPSSLQESRDAWVVAGSLVIA